MKGLGPRVDCQKAGGLLCKEDGRTGIHARGPPDLDLKAQIQWLPNLIACVQIKSDGSGFWVRGVAAEHRRSRAPRRRLAGVHQEWCSGVASTRAGVGCVQRVACDAPGPKPGTAGLCSPGMAAAAAARRSSPARCVRAVPVLGCGAKGSGRLYEANARQRGSHGAVWCCGGVAMAERRRGITGGSAPPTEWPTAQISWRKRRHGAPGCSPRGRIEGRAGAEGSSA